MSTFIIGALIFVLILNCLLLILLVLVQLPKKDAGAGMAFGGGTADALFGAGSGNVLTKITKYATATLLLLALLVGWLQDKAHTRSSDTATFGQMVDQKVMQPKTATQPSTSTSTSSAQQPPASLPAVVPAGTNAATK
jgi:preprotein translocase subunit SecG